MITILKYNLSQAARIIDIKGMGKHKIYKLLREVGIVDNCNKPFPEYIDEGYLSFGLPTVIIQGHAIKNPVTLVVGESGLNYLKNAVENYLLRNAQPIIYRRSSMIMETDGDTIIFRNAFEE